MPSLSTYAVFLATGMALLLVPGPAVLYVVTRSIEMGRAGGLAPVAGITTGTIAYVDSWRPASRRSCSPRRPYALAAGTVADGCAARLGSRGLQRWVGGGVLAGLGILAAVWTPSRAR